jgi:NitT/TauT family transport system ATP-binding protein
MSSYQNSNISSLRSIVEVSELRKHYGKLVVYEGLNFDIKEGEFLSIIGPSGCGKTTLLKILGGLIEPTSGEVKVHGQPVKTALESRELGFVFQNPVLLPWRTSVSNVALPSEIVGLKDSKASPKELLRIVGLEAFENSYPNELSGGMAQRVAIARALAFEPSLLLMDEPFGALDEITRNRMNLELLRIWKEGKTSISTVIFVTHSIPEAVFLSDRVIVLSSRPTRIQEIVHIDLARPRKTEMKDSGRYRELIEHVRKIIGED